MTDSASAATSAGRSPAGAWIAGFWGVAEATVFFIVPDVWLTRVAVKHGLALAMKNCGFALIGALLGGTLLWACARYNAASGLATFFDYLPGISPTMIEQAWSTLAEEGLGVMFRGAFSGIPYKLYALQAGTMGVSLLAFLSVSAVARLSRFIATSLVAWFLAKLLQRWLKLNAILWVHALAWLAFYAFYFSIHRG